MFKTADEFLTSVEAGNVKTIELSEVEGWVIPETHLPKHKRHNVLGVTPDRTGVRLATVDGEETVLPVTGLWRTVMVGVNQPYNERRIVQVLDGNTEYRYLINMRYYR